MVNLDEKDILKKVGIDHLCYLCNLCNLLRDLYNLNITKTIFMKLLQKIQFGVKIATFYDTSIQKGLSEQFETLKIRPKKIIEIY